MARVAPVAGAQRTLLIACGAIARELTTVLAASGFEHVEVRCLPPELHNRPERIPEAVRERIRAARPRFASVFVGYADCGTGGALDAVLAQEGAERLPGTHCYEFLAGSARFAELAAREAGTFYLTDFLARHFERLVLRGLGLDRHPELLGAYFGNYRRLVYLAQRDDPALLARARAAAVRLGLAFEHVKTGLGPLAAALEPLRRAAPAAVSGGRAR